MFCQFQHRPLQLTSHPQPQCQPHVRIPHPHPHPHPRPLPVGRTWACMLHFGRPGQRQTVFSIGTSTTHHETLSQPHPIASRLVSFRSPCTKYASTTLPTTTATPCFPPRRPLDPRLPDQSRPLSPRLLRTTRPPKKLDSRAAASTSAVGEEGGGRLWVRRRETPRPST